MGRYRQFDIALSFAGEDRQYASILSEALKNRNISVFYDNDYKSNMWGRDLYEYLTELYQTKARYCVVFVSEHYISKPWTIVERKAVQAEIFRRLGDKRDDEYILPIRLDNSEVPGLLSTIECLSWPPENEETIANAIAAKLISSGSNKAIVLSGIEIVCQARLTNPIVKIGGNVPFAVKPRCIIDGKRKIRLLWGKFVFIPLEPEIEHHVCVEIPQLFGGAGKADLECFIRAGEIKRYEYKHPVLLWNQGVLKRLR